MKIKVYIGFTLPHHSYNDSFSLDCISLDKKEVDKRLDKLALDNHTQLKVRTLDTDNPEVLKYI